MTRGPVEVSCIRSFTVDCFAPPHVGQESLGGPGGNGELGGVPRVQFATPLYVTFSLLGTVFFLVGGIEMLRS